MLVWFFLRCRFPLPFLMGWRVEEWYRSKGTRFSQVSFSLKRFLTKLNRISRFCTRQCWLWHKGYSRVNCGVGLGRLHFTIQGDRTNITRKRNWYILSSAANVMMTEPGAPTWFLAESMTLESYHSEMPEEHPAGSLLFWCISSVPIRSQTLASYIFELLYWLLFPCYMTCQYDAHAMGSPLSLHPYQCTYLAWEATSSNSGTMVIPGNVQLWD